MEDMLAKKGYRILPYRLAAMADKAARILRLILDDRAVMFSAEEARLILELAGESLGKGAVHES